jgi:hypothetical protein
MATNFFFNNFQASQEQLLLENLVIESIKIYGHDTYYIPRKLNNYDEVYGADDVSSYETAYPIEMYIKSIDGFSGDGEFLSKFGVEIRNQIVFSVARRIFSEEISQFTTQVRPNEGDIIWFPLNQRLFVIRYVNKYEMFYQLGALQTWEMTCEVFEYAGEKFSTGIFEIDEIQTKYNTDVFNWAILTEDGDRIMTEESNYLVLEAAKTNTIAPSDNDMIQQESDEFVDWTAQNPFVEEHI